MAVLVNLWNKNTNTSFQFDSVTQHIINHYSVISTYYSKLHLNHNILVFFHNLNSTLTTIYFGYVWL